MRERREDMRDERGLNACCERKLGADALALRGNLRDVRDIGLDLLLHPVDGTGELSDFVPVADSVLQLVLGRRVFDGKARRFRIDDVQRAQQHAVQIHPLPGDDEQHQPDQRQRDLVEQPVSHAGQLIHLPLYAQNSLNLPVGTLDPDHRGNMRIGFNVALVPDHQFLFRFLIIQRAVFLPVLVVGRFPEIAEIVLRIGAFMIDRREEERDMRVIRAIRQYHIDKRRAGSVAEMIHPVPYVQIRFRGAAAG